MQTAQTVVLIIVALAFLGMGGYALAAPAALARPFHLRADTPPGRSEIRAVYGGFGLAIAAVLAVAALDLAETRRGVVVTVAAALAGMAVGRLVSRLLDAPVAFYPIWLYFWIETLAAAALFATLI
ncbi:DUF4345 family protein [Nocardia sp. NPDC050406]|uniref:DUF4345 family protein n=1 Tax=Nocardia sp. NPDC050406 TaxID=3364318 RepID=UPI0037B70429